MIIMCVLRVSGRNDANSQDAETGKRLHSTLEAFNWCTIFTVHQWVHPSRGHGGWKVLPREGDWNSGTVAGDRSRLHGLRLRTEDRTRLETETDSGLQD